jgi:hypothetical protein
LIVRRIGRASLTCVKRPAPRPRDRVRRTTVLALPPVTPGSSSKAVSPPGSATPVSERAPERYPCRMQGSQLPAAIRGTTLLATAALLAACYGSFEFDGGEATVVVISRPPQSTTVTVGQPARFDVAVTGSGEFRYQWQRNGQAIAGASRAEHVTPPAGLADDGTLFTVTVCDASSCATSVPALLTVLRSW